jgi:hypothetical protein
LSESRNVRSDWASGTYLTQTTMFMRASSSSFVVAGRPAPSGTGRAVDSLSR